MGYIGAQCLFPDKPFNRVTEDAWEANKVSFQHLSRHRSSVASSVAASERRSRLLFNGKLLAGIIICLNEGGRFLLIHAFQVGIDE